MAGSWTLPSSSSNPAAASAPITTMPAATNPRITQEARRRTGAAGVGRPTVYQASEPPLR